MAIKEGHTPASNLSDSKPVQQGHGARRKVGPPGTRLFSSCWSRHGQNLFYPMCDVFLCIVKAA